MTTLAAFTFVLLAFCTPALADSAPPPRAVPSKIRFSVQGDGLTRSFDVMVSPEERCASASHKLADQQVEINACATRDAHLTIHWEVRGPTGEFRSSSSIPFEHGSTAELGSTAGPRLTVAVQ